jgi:hypothetical protein
MQLSWALTGLLFVMPDDGRSRAFYSLDPWFCDHSDGVSIRWRIERRQGQKFRQKSSLPSDLNPQIE